MAFELIKVSELPELTTPADANVLPIQDGDYLKRISFANLKDAAVGDMEGSLAAAYDSTATYAVGDYCIYKGRLYRCTTAIATAEAWTAGHWTVAVLTDDIASDLSTEASTRSTNDNALAADIAEALGDLAAVYSTSATYAVGDYCIYQGQLYRCTTAISTAEAWTAAHWSAVALGNDTRDLRSAFNATKKQGYDISIWEFGGIASATGEESESATRMRTGFLNYGVDVIKCTSGYKYIISAYDADNSNAYVGMWNGTAFNKSATWLTTAVSLHGLGHKNYKYRLVAATASDTTLTIATDAQNIIFCSNTDTALASQGIAADAQVTGNKIETLKSGLNGLSNELLATHSEKWYTGVSEEAYTSSTFSGFATSWINTSKKFANGLTVGVRSRADSNITQMKVRIESDDSTFVYEQVFPVNIGSTKQNITLPISCVIPSGLIWVAVAANQIATFDHSTVTGSAYKYYTNGNFNLSTLKESGGSVRRLAITLSYFSGINIPDGYISQEKLSFAEFLEPENLINVDDEDECKKGWWYYSTAVGSKVVMQEVSGYSYTALKAKTYGASKVTFDTYPSETYPPRIYWIGAVDADMTLLSYSVANQEVPITYTLPEGTAYVLASIQTMVDRILNKLMCVKGEAVTHYVKGVGERYLLDKCIVENDEVEADTISLQLPSSYDLVVGDTFQLFKKGIINAVNDDLYDVQFVCSKGKAFKRYFEITPTTAETLALDIMLYGSKHELLDSKSVNLVIRTKASSPSATKYVLCVGDSLTQGGLWVHEFDRRLTGSAGTPSGDSLTNIEFVGTRERNGTHYEGYGGWTFRSYNTANVDINAKVITCTHDKTEAEDQHSIYKASNNSEWKLETIESGSINIISVSGDYSTFPSTGTLTWVSGGINHSDIVYTASANAAGNPFWDVDSGKVDFAKYCTRLSVPRLDYVYVLLGWNNLTKDGSAYKTQAQTFIDNVHASYPNAKIVLMGLQIPARDGLANNYGANDNYANYHYAMSYVFDLDGWYSDLVTDNTNVSHFNLSGQFDTEYNMPTENVAVNSRNSTTVIMQTNGVHPATSGQYQIADAAYRCMTGLL